jgi:hypothetical protein
VGWVSRMKEEYWEMPIKRARGPFGRKTGIGLPEPAAQAHRKKA